ncbi:hypothetical protein BC826DRAFT_968227 [Russula brevipes]|nr:hypothetical protein BC826DRAFT_968227 [Russula brevipes]
MAVLVAAREKHNPSLPMVNDNYREEKTAVDGAQGGGTTHVRVLAVAASEFRTITNFWQIWSGNPYTCDLVRGQLVLLILAGRPWFSARSELSRAGLDQIITSHHVYASAWSHPSHHPEFGTKKLAIVWDAEESQTAPLKPKKLPYGRTYVRALPAVPTPASPSPFLFLLRAKNYRGNPGGREEMGLKLRVLRKDDCCCRCCRGETIDKRRGRGSHAKNGTRCWIRGRKMKELMKTRDEYEFRRSPGMGRKGERGGEEREERGGISPRAQLRHEGGSARKLYLFRGERPQHPRSREIRVRTRSHERAPLAVNERDGGGRYGIRWDSSAAAGLRRSESRVTLAMQGSAGHTAPLVVGGGLFSRTGRGAIRVGLTPRMRVPVARRGGHRSSDNLPVFVSFPDPPTTLITPDENTAESESSPTAPPSPLRAVFGLVHICVAKGWNLP